MFGDDSGASATPMNMFGSDDDAPSDYTPEDADEVVEEESVVDIVEY